MKNFLKASSIFLLTLCLACVGLPMAASEGEEKTVYFSSEQWNENTQDPNTGRYYMSHDTLSIQAYGDQGLELTGSGHVIYAFQDSFVQECPFLHFKIGPEGVKYIHVMRREAYWVASDVPEVSLELAEGEQTLQLAELLADHPAKNTGWVYVTIGIGDGSGNVGNMEYIYLSNTDASGSVYEKPVQPTVPLLDPDKEIRYQLKSYDRQTVDENGYGFLMSIGTNGETNIKATPSDKGVTLESPDGATGEAMNIAWVVPYEQLEKTPYLVIDIANEGREDEGPRTNIFAYWEGVAGSTAVFDLVPEAIGANSLNGITRLPLKYAVDSVPENLKGENGIAIIVTLGVERTDGTTFDPLVIRDAYLLGYEEGAQPVDPDQTSGSAENTVGSTTAGDATTDISSDATTAASQPSEDAGGVPVALIVGIVVAVAAVAVVVIVLVVRRKKTAN